MNGVCCYNSSMNNQLPQWTSYQLKVNLGLGLHNNQFKKMLVLANFLMLKCWY